MTLIIKALYVIVCVFLIMIILMQRGKDAAGDLFGAGSSAVLSSQGTTSFLVKFTSTLAGLFFTLSLILGFLINHSSHTIHLKDIANTKVMEQPAQKSNAKKSS